ncbi:MAG TPA: hypothetical protein VJT70_00875 [Sphingomicrobium sp.]|nr:hypothetical protein [Sphingomicrobium sp.]
MPVVRRGRVVRMEFRHNDRLAIGILSGRGGCVAERREQATSRRRYRLQLKALRQARDEERRRADAIWAEHQAIIDNPPPGPGPRIRSL